MQGVLQASYLRKLSDVPTETASPPFTKCRAWIEIVNINWSWDDCSATPSGFSSLLLADVAAGVCSAWAALLRYGTYGGIRLINVPNRNKTNGNFFRLYSTLININALLYWIACNYIFIRLSHLPDTLKALYWWKIPLKKVVLNHA